MTRTLVLGLGLADEGGVVDETILRGVVLGLKRAEQRLLGTQDLWRGLGVRGRNARRHQQAWTKPAPAGDTTPTPELWP